MLTTCAKSDPQRTHFASSRVLTNRASGQHQAKSQAPPLGRVDIRKDRLDAWQHECQSHAIQACKRRCLQEALKFQEEGATSC